MQTHLPERRRPTMRDVARQARVSLKTVSRVVNAEPGVSETLAARVRKAIDELGFRPHAGASTLRRSGGRTGTVGLLLPDVAGPFSAAVLRAVEDVAAEHAVLLLAGSVDGDPQRERDLVQALLDHRADGLVLAPTGADLGHLEGELRAGTAVVCVDRPAPGLAVDAVVATNADGTAEAVAHLAAIGHRRIAFLGGRRGSYPSDERERGHARALAAAGLAVDPALVVRGLDHPCDADRAVAALLDAADPPTALFAGDGDLTMGAVRALHRLDRQDRVALAGFDDVPLGDLLHPGVTVVTQDAAAMGHTAATVLFARLDGDRAPARVIPVRTTLVRRGSGEIPPAR